MKKRTFALALLLLAAMLQVNAQPKIDSLVEAGIEYHDNGEYEKAIEVYTQALNIDPISPLVNYEIALTYMHSGKYEKSIEHSDVVINLNKEYLVSAYLTKGSSLDYLGRIDESIAVFEEGIERFDGHYLLYYNLGVNYQRIGDLAKAEDAFINALGANIHHASSHMSLGYVKADQKQRIQSLLCLYYFLFIEPDTDRSKATYTLLQDQLKGNVKIDAEDPNKINVYLSSNIENSGFGAADLMISMMEASSHSPENSDKTPEELFIDSTTSFLSILGELKDQESREENIWWNFYVPVLYDIAKSGHINTFCYYISQSSNPKALEWLQRNESKLNAFSRWIDEE